MNCNWHEGLVNQFAETIHSPSLLFQATKTSLGTTPHLITVTTRIITFSGIPINLHFWQLLGGEWTQHITTDELSLQKTLVAHHPRLCYWDTAVTAVQLGWQCSKLGEEIWKPSSTWPVSPCNEMRPIGIMKTLYLKLDIQTCNHSRLFTR